MSDSFSYRTRRLSDPAVSIFDVTPDDAADLPRLTQALNVATSGTLRVTMANGSIGEVSVASGQVIPLSVRRVWLTGTTATGIRGLA